MASSSVTGSVAERSPASVGRAFLDAIVTGDTGTIEALLDREARWWVQGWGEQGRDPFVASLKATIARASVRAMKILSVTCEDDRVAIEALGSFAFAEGEYCNSYVYLLRIRDGRIVDGREYLDTRTAARFFG